MFITSLITVNPEPNIHQRYHPSTPQKILDWSSPGRINFRNMTFFFLTLFDAVIQYLRQIRAIFRRLQNRMTKLFEPNEILLLLLVYIIS